MIITREVDNDSASDLPLFRFFVLDRKRFKIFLQNEVQAKTVQELWSKVWTSRVLIVVLLAEDQRGRRQARW